MPAAAGLPGINRSSDASWELARGNDCTAQAERIRRLDYRTLP